MSFPAGPGLVTIGGPGYWSFLAGPGLVTIGGPGYGSFLKQVTIPKPREYCIHVQSMSVYMLCNQSVS